MCTITCSKRPIMQKYAHGARRVHTQVRVWPSAAGLTVDSGRVRRPICGLAWLYLWHHWRASGLRDVVVVFSESDIEGTTSEFAG